MLAERLHIFEEGTETRFTRLFEIFHDICIAKLMCFGVAEKYMTLEEIPMTKVLTTNEYIANTIGAIMKIQPSFICVSPEVQLMLVDIPQEYGSQMYCMQTVSNWPGLEDDESCCQLWEMEPGVTMDHINKLWNEN